MRVVVIQFLGIALFGRVSLIFRPVALAVIEIFASANRQCLVNHWHLCSNECELFPILNQVPYYPAKLRLCSPFLLQCATQIQRPRTTQILIFR